MIIKLLRMNTYLKNVKSASKNVTDILAVMGNESVDLDSAVSSISLAYHLNKFGTNSRLLPNDKRRKSYSILPIINCKKEHLPLKTEVTYWLKEHGIELDSLICKDEINIDAGVENFILVDHHVSPYHEKVVSVLDHRPYDEKSLLEDECIVNIQEVGSCASLVLEAIKTDLGIEDIKKEESLLHFLYGPIILDTINYSIDADKVRELDFEMTAIIERALKIEDTESTRQGIFKALVDARADVSSLNSLQILSKDLKIVSNKDSTVKIAMSGLHVFEYPFIDAAAENIKIFAEQENIDVVMFMGMKPVNDSVERHLAVIDIKNKNLYDDIIKTVESMKNPDLKLVLNDDIKFLDGKFYNQGNVKASRKQILPVIKDLLQTY
ncbi:exopolyphosphatase PRUNE1 [Chironomus tepperi]|uniref:exopolyphosphatase PRUNE1 n=1 Tax=Chironomus tepperi TaxID=113505 RepID=UPI00391F035A